MFVVQWVKDVRLLREAKSMNRVGRSVGRLVSSLRKFCESQCVLMETLC